MKLHTLDIDETVLAGVCQRHRIRELLLFGSVTRPSFGPESDVDAIARFAPGGKPDLWTFAGVALELSDVFGRQVHLHTDGMIPERLRPAVLRDAVVAYAG